MPTTKQCHRYDGSALHSAEPVQQDKNGVSAGHMVSFTHLKVLGAIPASCELYRGVPVINSENIPAIFVIQCSNHAFLVDRIDRELRMPWNILNAARSVDNNVNTIS